MLTQVCLFEQELVVLSACRATSASQRHGDGADWRQDICTGGRESRCVNNILLSLFCNWWEEKGVRMTYFVVPKLKSLAMQLLCKCLCCTQVLSAECSP